MKARRLFAYILYLLFAGLCKPLYAQTTLKTADSLFTQQNWKAAKEKYVTYLADTSKNSLAWNRLGYCNHNLGFYNDAITDYNRASEYIYPEFL